MAGRCCGTLLLTRRRPCGNTRAGGPPGRPCSGAAHPLRLYKNGATGPYPALTLPYTAGGGQGQGLPAAVQERGHLPRRVPRGHRRAAAPAAGRHLQRVRRRYAGARPPARRPPQHVPCVIAGHDQRPGHSWVGMSMTYAEMHLHACVANALYGVAGTGATCDMIWLVGCVRLCSNQIATHAVQHGSLACQAHSPPPPLG